MAPARLRPTSPEDLPIDLDQLVGPSANALLVVLAVAAIVLVLLVLWLWRRVARIDARLRSLTRGEETAEVVSAVPLDEAQLASVKDAVARFAGRPVQLTTEVDPGLLGGIVVRIGSRMIDASLKTKLQNLELSMRGVR